MRIVIFGANGRTGRLVTRLALERGHHAVVVTRRPDEFPFADPQLTVAGADVRDPSSLTEIVRGADAVLSSLGVPFSLRRIDTYSVGVANIVTAMRDAGVRRLAVVSSTGAYPYPNRIDPPAALPIRRTRHHPHDRQEHLRRPAPDGEHHPRQRSRLDDRAAVRAFRPAATDELRCRGG